MNYSNYICLRLRGLLFQITRTGKFLKIIINGSEKCKQFEEHKLIILSYLCYINNLYVDLNILMEILILSKSVNIE